MSNVKIEGHKKSTDTGRVVRPRQEALRRQRRRLEGSLPYARPYRNGQRLQRSRSGWP